MVSEIGRGGLLHELLALLNDGGLRSTAELARQLGVSEGLVVAMADYLTRRGYLATLDLGCSTACHGCAQHSKTCQMSLISPTRPTDQPAYRNPAARSADAAR